MGVVGISKILVSLSGIILIPILTRYLGEHDYGLYVQVRASIGLMIPLVLLGLDSGIVRLFSSRENLDEISRDFSSVSSFIFLIGIIFSGFLFFYPKLLANFVFEGNILIVQILAGLLFVRSFSKLFLKVFQAFREMKKYSILRVVIIYSEISLAILLVLIGYGLIEILVMLLIVRGLFVLFMVYLNSKRFKIKKPDLSNIKEYLDYSLPLIPNSFSFWIVETSDRYLIGFFLGAAYVGYYHPPYAFGKIVPFMIGQMLLFVLQPTLSDFYEKKDIKMVKRVLSLSLKYFLLISVPYLFGVILFYEPIIAIFSTETIAKEGGFIAIFTALTGVVYGSRKIYLMLLILKKKTKVIGFITILAGLINLGVNLYLIPKIGIMGAGISTLLSYSILSILVIYFGLKNFHLKLNYKYVPKILVSSIGMFLLLYMLQIAYPINFVLMILVGIIVYFSILFLIKGITKKEIKFMKDLISGR